MKDQRFESARRLWQSPAYWVRSIRLPGQQAVGRRGPLHVAHQLGHWLLRHHEHFPVDRSASTADGEPLGFSGRTICSPLRYSCQRTWWRTPTVPIRGSRRLRASSSFRPRRSAYATSSFE